MSKWTPVEISTMNGKPAIRWQRKGVPQLGESEYVFRWETYDCSGTRNDYLANFAPKFASLGPLPVMRNKGS